MRDPGNLDETVSGVRDGDLTDLLARVESASGPDRELDRRIALVGGWERSWSEDLQPHRGGWYWKDVVADYSATHEDDEHPPAYTASLDASLGLVERLLPGWMPCIRKDPRAAFDGLWHAFVARAGTGREQHAAWGSTPALALLAALLRALIAQAADTSARNVPAREGSANASRAGTRDHSLAPTNSEPSGGKD